MKFTVGKAVSIDEVPASAMRSGRGAMEPVFEAIGALKRGSALPVTFTTEKDGTAARCSLRKIAKREGEFLSSSRSEDRLTFYFWLEPKGEVEPIASAKRTTRAA